MSVAYKLQHFHYLIILLIIFTDPDVQVQPEVSTVAVEEPEPELGRRRLWADEVEKEVHSTGDNFNWRNIPFYTGVPPW